MTEVCRMPLSITHNMCESLWHQNEPIHIWKFKYSLKAEHIKVMKMENRNKQTSTPALTLASPSETPAVQHCWLQPRHSGLVYVLLRSPPHCIKDMWSHWFEAHLTQEGSLGNTTLPHFSENWLPREKNCPANAPTTWVLTHIPSDARLTPGKPKS